MSHIMILPYAHVRASQIRTMLFDPTQTPGISDSIQAMYAA